MNIKFCSVEEWTTSEKLTNLQPIATLYQTQINYRLCELINNENLESWKIRQNVGLFVWSVRVAVKKAESRKRKSKLFTRWIWDNLKTQKVSYAPKDIGIHVITVMEPV